MAEEPETIDIDNEPVLVRLLDEINASGHARILRRGNENVALVTPLKSSGLARYGPGRVKTAADLQAFRDAAGGWKGLVDTDKLVEDVYESRRISSRPAVDL